jgi:hypothetical protein
MTAPAANARNGRVTHPAACSALAVQVVHALRRRYRSVAR